MVCVACHLTPLHPFVWLRDVSLVFLHSPLFPSPIHVDARGLCEAALSCSLKKLDLRVAFGATHKELAEIFAFQLEELALSLNIEVSSACSPGMYVRTYICSCEVWTLKDQLT